MKPSSSLDVTVVQKIVTMKKFDKIPQHLMTEEGEEVGFGEEFDPNSYFTVLTHLAMKPGYSLDFFYDYMHDLGGHPCLYARPVDDPYLQSRKEYNAWKKKNDLLSFLIADGSPDSFFQLSVFKTLADQFYLYWHAGYNDTTVITSPAALDRLISETNSAGFGVKLTDDQLIAAREIPVEPCVELADTSAAVTFCTFTKWGGFRRLRETFHRNPPHLLIGQDVLDKVHYECGVCY